jgi:uncharacterized protein YjbJ (UPF0337 family)
MNKLRDKAQGRTKQVVGQMVGDDALVNEGKEQERRTDQADGSSEDTSDQAPERRRRSG